ncbi:proton-conducting transporter transmembrane domain-containing protein [Halomonas hibernica]|uniref:proton-conducting transporter transmembrane domain-containing protein n=1 Tax=Halomonas hibernica TaxID=2591147 RepID=UPI0015567435|nr:proton-conducting transporter membrane subunit [Halomonas hibernica]
MITLLLVITLCWPICVSLMGVWKAYRTPATHRRYFSWVWLSAAWPALLLAYIGEAQWVIDAWMLGGHWSLNALSRPWLAFTALLWCFAAIHARGYFAKEQASAQADDRAAERRLLRLALLWPLTFVGNVLLIIAQDIATFYLGFALMTFAAYGLVVHNGTPEAKLGARAYLILAVVGEGLILGGLLWAAGSAETVLLAGVREGIATAEYGALMACLLWLGLGVKAGVIGLHVWLPLAHPAAPAPASAVLSGAMIKAGLLGWIYVLPLGETSLSGALTRLGDIMVIAGLAAAFGAALYGVWQRHPKAVLAYSSISQMGMLTAMVAMGLAAPEVWPLLLPGVVLFAAHHALAKGALFMGTSVSEHLPRWPLALVWVLLALPALSLTGAFGAGLVSKWGVKSALYEMHHEQLVALLTWAAIGTSALVSVSLRRQWQQRSTGGSHPGQWGAWLAALTAALVTPIWLPLPQGSAEIPPLKEWFSLMWPLPVGIVLTWAGWWLTRHWRIRPLPAGDLWWPYAWLVQNALVGVRSAGQWCGDVKAASVGIALAIEKRMMARLTQLTAMESWMRHHTSGLMMALAIVLALLLIWEGSP